MCRVHLMVFATVSSEDGLTKVRLNPMVLWAWYQLFRRWFFVRLFSIVAIVCFLACSRFDSVRCYESDRILSLGCMSNSVISSTSRAIAGSRLGFCRLSLKCQHPRRSASPAFALLTSFISVWTRALKIPGSLFRSSFAELSSSATLSYSNCNLFNSVPLVASRNRTFNSFVYFFADISARIWWWFDVRS